MLHLDLGEKTRNSSRSSPSQPRARLVWGADSPTHLFGVCFTSWTQDLQWVCVSEGLGLLVLALVRFCTCPQPPAINTKFSRKLLWGTPKTVLSITTNKINKYQKKNFLKELCFSVSPKHQKVSAPTHSCFLLCSISSFLLPASSQPLASLWLQ